MAADRANLVMVTGQIGAVLDFGDLTSGDAAVGRVALCLGAESAAVVDGCKAKNLAKVACEVRMIGIPKVGCDLADRQ